MTERSINFTKSTLEGLPAPEAGRITYKDTKQVGLHLRVSATGVKTFSLLKRVNGKPERVTLGRFPEMTVELARRKATKLSGQIAMGISPSAERRRASIESKTLRDHTDDYIAFKKDLKPSTVRDIKNMFALALNDWLDKPISSITQDMVRERHAKYGSERSKARANVMMRYLRAIINAAIDDDLELEKRGNPVRVLTKKGGWYKIERRKTYIKSHKLGVWLQAVEHMTSDWGDCFLFLLLTGLRRSEAIGLKWEDVDFIDRTFIVRDTKNHSDHELPITDAMMAILARRRLNTDNRSMDSLVFLDADGKLLGNADCRVKAIERAAGVRATPHDLRRTFASIAESLDISGYSLKRLLNHRTSDVTDGYVILSMERLRGLMEKISLFIEGQRVT